MLKDTNVKTGVVYPNFNPKNFWKECEEYGGIENHPGQLYYANFSNRRPYPISPFHAVQPEMGAEHGNALYVENVLARGFHACSVVSHGMFQSDQEQNEFRDAITEMMGVEGTGAVLTVRDENVALQRSPLSGWIRSVRLLIPTCISRIASRCGKTLQFLVSPFRSRLLIHR